MPITGDFASVDSLIPILKENLRAKDSVCTNLGAQAKGEGAAGKIQGLRLGGSIFSRICAGNDLCM